MKPAVIGYARTSTAEQKAGLEAQERDLRAVGVDKLFAEQTSAVGPRAALESAIEYIREGDTLVVTKLDRLARSVADAVSIVERLAQKGASLRVLAMGLDTGTSTGRLMLNMLASVAQFEREVMLERQREGIAKAKAEGAYKGRAPTAKRKADDVLRLAAEGMKREEIAAKLGIGVASVYRILAAGKAADAA